MYHRLFCLQIKLHILRIGGKDTHLYLCHQAKSVHKACGNEILFILIQPIIQEVIIDVVFSITTSNNVFFLQGKQTSLYSAC